MIDNDLEALRILRDALDTDPGERDDYLSMRCGADTQLRERVDALLRGIADVDIASPNRTPQASALPSDDVSEDPLVGELLGQFRVVERIGRGGMGVVYHGEREGADFSQQVAIKLIRRGFDFDDIRARFLRERRILAKLSHRNLARFIDGGVAADGRPWFALEFVDGQSITKWCDAHRLDIRARVRLFLEVCSAVQYAHTQLIVHRDLKPGNVLVDETGTVRLLDFGVAGLLLGDGDDASQPSTIGVHAGLTPEYAAPEQLAGEAVGVSADVYALGVILYESISGVLPHASDRRAADASARAIDELPQPLGAAIDRIDARANQQRDVTSATLARERSGYRRTDPRAFRRLVRGDLSRIIDTALAKEPQRRYPTVAAFAADLQRWLSGLPVRVSGNRFGYRLRKFVVRNRVAVALAGLAALAVLAGVVGMAWQVRETRLQRDAAETEAERSKGVRDYIMLMFGEAGELGDADKVSVRDVFKRNADRVFDTYKAQPEAGWNIALMLGEFYLHLGDEKSARSVLERLLRWPGLERQPDLLASARYNLAQVELDLGDTARARALLDQAQSFWKSQGSRFALNLNLSRDSQSEIEQAEGHPDVAIQTLEHAIAERRTLLGKPDRELATAINGLAFVFLSAGRDEEGLARADESIALYTSLGLAHSSAGLAAINNRAMAAYRLGRFDIAIAGMREAVRLRRQLFGPTTELAEAMNNLGVVLTRQDKAEQAIPILEEALHIAIEKAGVDGQTAFAPRRNLADAYIAVGRIAEAEPLAEKSVVIGRDKLGAGSIFAGAAYSTLARVRLAQGRTREARVALDQATSIFVALGEAGAAYLKNLDALRATLNQN